MQTTIRCSEDERNLINTTARKNSLYTSKFLLKCLNDYLPLSEQPKIDKTINRQDTKIGLTISNELRNKIQSNIYELSDDFRKVKMWEIILACGLKGCGDA